MRAGAAHRLGIAVTAIRVIAIVTALSSMFVYVVLWVFTQSASARQF